MATPRSSSTTSVAPPLNSTSRQRTPRTMRASRARSCSSVASGAGRPVSSMRSGDSAIAQTVAHATYRPDHLAGIAQLVAQVVDIGVHRVRGHGHPERPRVVEQLVARERLVGMAQEALEQGELARRELHGSIV